MNVHNAINCLYFHFSYKFSYFLNISLTSFIGWNGTIISKSLLMMQYIFSSSLSSMPKPSSSAKYRPSGYTVQQIAQTPFRKLSYLPNQYRTHLQPLKSGHPLLVASKSISLSATRSVPSSLTS